MSSYILLISKLFSPLIDKKVLLNIILFVSLVSFFKSKSFEFNTQLGETLNETETYFLRLSRARKNYLPN